MPHLLPLCRERVGENLWELALNTALAELMPLHWVLLVLTRVDLCFTPPQADSLHPCLAAPPFPLLLLPLLLTFDLSLGEGGKTPAKLHLAVVSLGQVCRQQFVALHSEKILQDLSEFMVEKYCRYS